MVSYSYMTNRTFNNKIEHLHDGLTKQSVVDMATFLLSAYSKMQKKKKKELWLDDWGSTQPVHIIMTLKLRDSHCQEGML